MRERDILRLLDTPSVLRRIREQLAHYQRKLVELAEDDQIRDKADQENILRFLRDKQLPIHPATIEEVMKNFASSACSYSVVRRQLTWHIGAIPTVATIADALAGVFSDERFRNDDYWRPSSLKELVLDLAARLRLTDARDRGSREIRPRILRVLHDGASVIETRSKNGPAQYYSDIEWHLTSPETAWKMLSDFSAKICHMGEGLSADFMKNIGFQVFVKPDFHFLRQLPELAGVDT